MLGVILTGKLLIVEYSLRFRELTRLASAQILIWQWWITYSCWDNNWNFINTSYPFQCSDHKLNQFNFKLRNKFVGRNKFVHLKWHETCQNVNTLIHFTAAFQNWPWYYRYHVHYCNQCDHIRRIIGLWASF